MDWAGKTNYVNLDTPSCSNESLRRCRFGSGTKIIQRKFDMQGSPELEADVASLQGYGRFNNVLLYVLDHAWDIDRRRYIEKDDVVVTKVWLLALALASYVNKHELAKYLPKIAINESIHLAVHPERDLIVFSLSKDRVQKVSIDIPFAVIATAELSVRDITTCLEPLTNQARDIIRAMELSE